jgi:hypothetical protein
VLRALRRNVRRKVVVMHGAPCALQLRRYHRAMCATVAALRWQAIVLVTQRAALAVAVWLAGPGITRGCCRATAM